MLYAYIGTAIAALLIGFGGGWKTQGWRWDAADKQRIEQEAKEQQRANERAQSSSSTFEKKRSTNEIQYRTVTVTLEKIVDRPVYRNDCFDDSGLQHLNEQITNSTHSGKP